MIIFSDYFTDFGNIKAVMLDIPEPSMLDLRMQTCPGSSEPLSHGVSTKIS